MAKRISSCIVICLFLAILVALTSCDFDNGPTNSNPPTYKYNDTVHWLSDGGAEEPHSFEGGVCTVCGFTNHENVEEETDPNPSKLSFAVYDTYAVVVGLGQNTDKHLVIPSTYMGKPVTTIAERGLAYVYSEPQYDTVTLPDSITTIEDNAFYCNSIKALHIGKGLKNLTTHSLDDMWLETITVDEENPNFKAIDNVLYSKDGKTLVKYSAEKIDSEFIVPAGVEHIAPYAFRSCKNLTSIILPEGLKTIEMGAFCWSDSLATLNIPEGVTTIGDSVFGYTALTEVIFPDSVTRIGNNTFHSIQPLTHVHIGAGLEAFPEGFLSNNPQSVQITISEDNPYFMVIDNVVYDKSDMSVVFGESK